MHRRTFFDFFFKKKIFYLLYFILFLFYFILFYYILSNGRRKVGVLFIMVIAVNHLWKHMISRARLAFTCIGNAKVVVGLFPFFLLFFCCFFFILFLLLLGGEARKRNIKTIKTNKGIRGGASTQKGPGAPRPRTSFDRLCITLLLQTRFLLFMYYCRTCHSYAHITCARPHAIASARRGRRAKKTGVGKKGERESESESARARRKKTKKNPTNI
jgi:hypothetical protein